MLSHPSSRAETSPPPLDESPDDDERVEEAEIPLTMTASAVLTTLPKDARSALREAGREKDGDRKGIFLFPSYIPTPICPNLLSSQEIGLQLSLSLSNGN